MCVCVRWPCSNVSTQASARRWALATGGCCGWLALVAITQRILADASGTVGSMPPYLLMQLAVPAPEDACQAVQLVHEGVPLLDRHHAHTTRLFRTEHDIAHTFNLATPRSGCLNMQATLEVPTLTAASSPPPRLPTKCAGSTGTDCEPHRVQHPARRLQGKKGSRTLARSCVFVATSAARISCSLDSSRIRSVISVAAWRTVAIRATKRLRWLRICHSNTQISSVWCAARHV